MQKFQILSVLSLVFFSTHLSAEERKLDVAFGISTFGATITPRYEINNSLAVRVPVSYALSDSIQEKYDMMTSIFTLNVIDSSDINMIGGAGILFDRATKKKNVNYSVGIMTPIYKIDQNDSTDTHFGLGPYTGLNYTYGKADGLSLSVDAGAMYDINSDQTSSQGDGIFDKALSLTGIDAKTIPYFSASFQYSF